MDDLPLELYLIIFKYLNIRDLFKVRLLSKKFNKIAREEYAIKELVFGNKSNEHKDYRLKDNWHFIFKPINFNNYVIDFSLNFFKSSLFSLKNLKCLRIDVIDTFDLKFLNEFSCLEHLEYYGNLCSDDEHKSLRLPNLERLLFDPTFITIKIDCIALESIYLSDDEGSSTFDSLNINYPLAIKRLISTYQYSLKLSAFKNLEYLQCVFSKDLSDVLRNYLSLKELRIHTTDDSTSDVLSVLKQVIRHKNSLTAPRNYLKIYFSNLELANEDHLAIFENYPSISFLDESQARQQLVEFANHYQLLADHLTDYRFIDYNVLIASFGNRLNLPFGFFKKFNNIQYIEINSEVQHYQNHLIELIDNCPNLKSLIINKSKLDQLFYNELARISSLFALKVFEDEIEIDFEFVGKIAYLKEFKSNQLNAKGFESLAKLNYLDYFEFEFKKQKYSIFKFTNLFDIYQSGGNWKVRLDFEQIIAWFISL